MGRPFSILKNIEKYKAKAEAYDTWKKKTDTEKSTLYQTKIEATGNKRNARTIVEGWLIPFDIPQTSPVILSWNFLANPGDTDATGVETATTIIADVREALLNETTPFVYTKYADLPVGKAISKAIKMSRLAKVTLTEIGAAGTRDGENISRITGAKYTYGKRDSISASFGQQTNPTGITNFGVRKGNY